MILRKGKTKHLVENSIESALLAVETYNSPKKEFRNESYIVLMIIALTKLFHVHFNHSIGNKYYYKNSNGRYRIIDGERKTWELKTCIEQYKNVSDPVRQNFIFFIKLRNKIEHSTVDQNEIGKIIFGECQALLYNYENLLIKIFGEEYAINESLAFSLQFSLLRTKEQLQASKRLLSSEMINIRKFIGDFRQSLSEDTFNSQEFSSKLIQVPKVSNTSRNDLSIEFVNWTELSDDDKKNYEHLVTLIKPKVIKQKISNLDKFTSGQVVREIVERVSTEFNSYDHSCLYFIFSIHPYGYEKKDKEEYDTNTKYCLYDEPHRDYVFYNSWIEFIESLVNDGKMSRDQWRKYFREKEKKDINQFI